MVAEEAGDDAVVHHGLVRLVLEVGLPAVVEVRRRPLLEGLQLFLGGPDLDAGLDAVCGEGAGALESPFVEDPLGARLLVIGSVLGKVAA